LHRGRPLTCVPEWLTLRNAARAPLASIPRHDFSELSEQLLVAVARGERVCALAGWRGASGGAEILAVLAADSAGLLRVAIGVVPGASFRSLTPECPQVHLFERELFETLELAPLGHASAKPGR